MNTPHHYDVFYLLILINILQTSQYRLQKSLVHIQIKLTLPIKASTTKTTAGSLQPDPFPQGSMPSNLKDYHLSFSGKYCIKKERKKKSNFRKEKKVFKITKAQNFALVNTFFMRDSQYGLTFSTSIRTLLLLQRSYLLLFCTIQ